MLTTINKITNKTAGLFLFLTIMFLSAAGVLAVTGSTLAGKPLSVNVSGSKVINELIITDAPGQSEITDANDIYIRIPDSVNAVWDVTDIVANIINPAVGRVSDAVSYPNPKTLKLDVIAGFDEKGGEVVRVSGLEIIGVNNKSEAGIFLWSTGGDAGPNYMLGEQSASITVTSGIFNEIFHRPLIGLLVFLYEKTTFNNLGFAIIILTILVRLALFPIFHKTTKHQRLTQKLQPHIKKLQEQHKHNKEEQTKEIMKLYSQHGINPMTPFLLLIVQLPILIALYGVFKDGASVLYTIVPNPEILNNLFLGFIDLKHPSFYIVIIAVVAQYFQGRMAAPKPTEGKPDQAQQIAKNMILIGPALTLAILWSFPSAIALYWLTSTLFSILQQILVDRKIPNSDMAIETVK